jgi:site-specific DNA recombinase
MAAKRTKETDKTLSALVYCRVSTVKQENETTSLESQADACIAHAEKLGYSIGRVIKEAFSGAELWDRPLLAEARAEIKAGRYQALVFYAIDRLSRDIAHLAIIADEVERAGASLVCVTENLDNTPEGKLLQSVRGYVAEVERQKIRERCVRGKRQIALSGKVHNSGSELYGFRRDKARGVREIYEPEARIIRQMYGWVIEGVTIRGIIRQLNEQGTPAPSVGKRVYADGRHALWGMGAVRRILREPAYKGEAYAWRFKGGTRRFEMIVRPREEWIRLPEETTPAIVSPEVWQAVQDRLASNCGDETRNIARPDLLRGRVFCSVCGRKMRGESEHGKRNVYRCSSRETPSGACGSRRIPAAPCEHLIWEKIVSILERPEIIAAEVKRRSEEGTDARAQIEADREAAQRELKRAEDELRRLVSRAGQADDDLWEIFEKEIAAKREAKKRFEKVIAELEARLEAEDQATRNLTALTDYCAQVRNRLSEFDFAEKRLAIEALDARVTGSGRDWRLDVSLPYELEEKKRANCPEHSSHRSSGFRKDDVGETFADHPSTARI